MLLSDLITHTRSVLPLFTDKFTDNRSVVSLTKTGNTVSLHVPEHGLSVGDQFLLSGLKTKVEITDITTVNGVATATCATPHDLTYGYTLTAEMTSTETAYEGTFTIQSVIDDYKFTFNVTGTPPSATGFLFTFHNLGFNGVHTVTTVTSVSVIEFTLQNDSLLAAGGCCMNLSKNPRISGAATLNRALESYTRQKTDDLWGFFVINSSVTSDDRFNNNDSKNERQEGDDFKLRLIQDISFYVFISSRDDISGRVSFDLAQSLLRSIYKTLAGYRPIRIFTSEPTTLLMPSAHEVEEYDGSFIIYRYDFQATEFVLSEGCSIDPNEFMANTGDTLPNFRTSDLRCFNWKANNQFDSIIKDDVFEV